MSTSTVLPEFAASPPSWTAQRKASAKAGSSSSAQYLARHQLQLRRVAAGSGNGYGPLNHPDLTRPAPHSSRRQDGDDGTGTDGDDGDEESDNADWCSSITSMLPSTDSANGQALLQALITFLQMYVAPAAAVAAWIGAPVALLAVQPNINFPFGSALAISIVWIVALPLVYFVIPGTIGNQLFKGLSSAISNSLNEDVRHSSSAPKLKVSISAPTGITSLAKLSSERSSVPKGVQGFLDHQKEQQRKRRAKRAAQAELRLMSHARRRRDEGANPEEIEIEIADMLSETKRFLNIGDLLSAGSSQPSGPSCFVFEFHPDSSVSTLQDLRIAVSSILAAANPGDMVLLQLDSPGGAVTQYGIASMEIERLTKAGLDVHAHVETYACSGGYLLASCCNTISCTRWAKVGSIGVVIEFLNYSKLLNRVGVENLQLTAGKMKRTVSQMSEVTGEKKKYVEETLVRTHEEFKTIIRKNRPQIKDETCQGQVWSAMEALEKDMGLIDEIISYPELIERLSQTFTVQEVKVDEVKDFPFNPMELFSKALKGLREPVMSLLGSNAMLAASLVEPSARSPGKDVSVDLV